MFIGKIILIALFVLTLAGCESERRMTTMDDALLSIIPARFQNTGIDVSTKPVETQSVERVIEALKAIDARPLKIDSIKANMEVTITAGDSRRTMNAQFCADRAGNARLKLTAVLGIVAVDLSIKDGVMTCIMPTKKIAVINECAGLKSGGPELLALLVSVVNASDMVCPRAWAKDATGRRMTQAGNEPLIEIEGGTGSPRLRQATLNVDDRVLKSQTIYAAGGAVLGTIDYGDYATNLCPGRDDALPRLVTIVGPHGSVRVELKIKKVEINTALPEAAFKLVPRDPLQAPEALVEALSGK